MIIDHRQYDLVERGRYSYVMAADMQGLSSMVPLKDSDHFWIFGARAPTKTIFWDENNHLGDLITRTKQPFCALLAWLADVHLVTVIARKRKVASFSIRKNMTRNIKKGF